MPELHRFDMSWQTLWRIAIFGALIVLILTAGKVVGVFLISIVVSLGLDPAVSFLERNHIPRLLGTLMVFLTGIVIFTAMVYFIIPIVINELGGFLSHFNQALSSFVNTDISKATLKDLQMNYQSVMSTLSFAGTSVGVAVSTVAAKLIFILAAFLVSFYLTVEKNGPERLLKIILPNSYEHPVMSVFEQFKLKIRYWFAAQLAMSVVVGLIVGIGMWVLGVRYAIILGLLAGIFEIVPMIGPIITGVAAFVIAVSDSFSLGLYAVIFFMVVQQVENHLLLPLVMGKSMKVHPVVVIIALLAGGEIAGLIGVVLAVPIAVLAQESFNYLSEAKNAKPALGI